MKLNKKQKKAAMIGAALGVGYMFYKSNTGPLGFLTLPYSINDSYSYTPQPSFQRYTYEEPSYSYPVRFTSDNASPFQRQTVSAKMSDSAYFNMVRQISEEDGFTVIRNYDSFTQTPFVAPGATQGAIRSVKAQVGNALSSDRLTSEQRTHLSSINTALGERVVADSVDGYSAMGGVF